MTETAVYKAYDADGALLYVGVAKDFLFRWKSHRREAEWWKLAQRFEVVLYATRDEALAAGCTCPVMDNGHGRGYMGDGERFGWVVSGDCPIHAQQDSDAHEPDGPLCGVWPPNMQK